MRIFSFVGIGNARAGELTYSGQHIALLMAGQLVPVAPFPSMVPTLVHE